MKAMTQEELDALPDVTPQILPEERVVNGRKVIVPVQKGGDLGALYPMECTIDSQGYVLFDLTEIPEGLARDIYYKLKNKFDGDSA